MKVPNGLKLQRGIFITWSVLWFLALLPVEFIHKSLSLVFLQIEDAVSSWDRRYLTWGQDYIQDADWHYKLTPQILIFVFAMWTLSVFLALKVRAQVRCSRWIWRILWLVAMILSYCFVRSEVIVASTPWETIWDWFGAMIIMVPFWLLQPADLAPLWRSRSNCQPNAVD